jgi:predicted DNA-binding transcriptional regulator AlpA
MTKLNTAVCQPWASVPATGPVLRPDAAAEYLGLSITHYYEQARRGILPKPIKMGLRASGVPRPWLDAVVAANALVSGGAI